MRRGRDEATAPAPTPGCHVHGADTPAVAGAAVLAVALALVEPREILPSVILMRRWLVCSLVVLAAVLGGARPARADLAAQFAAWFDVKPDAVRDIAGFELPAGGDYTHVLVGRFQRGEHLLGGGLILRCDAKQCQGARIWLQAADRAEVYGLVDLNGAPGPLPARAQYGGTSWYRKLDGKGLPARPAWPAIVFHTETARQTTGGSRFRGTVTGTERRGRIVVVSLLRADERSPRVLDEHVIERYPSGAGTTTTFRTERGSSKDALDLVGREQRHLDSDSRCRRPDPVDVRYVMKGRRYERAALPARAGC